MHYIEKNKHHPYSEYNNPPVIERPVMRVHRQHSNARYSHLLVRVTAVHYNITWSTLRSGRWWRSRSEVCLFASSSGAPTVSHIFMFVRVSVANTMKSTEVQNPRRNKCRAVNSREELSSGRVPSTVPYRTAYNNYTTLSLVLIADI